MSAPETTPTGGPRDGVEAMLAILAALSGRHPLCYQEVAELTGLAPRLLRGYVGILREDGLLIHERCQALRLTNAGEATLREFGMPDGGSFCNSPDTGTGPGPHEPERGQEQQ